MPDFFPVNEPFKTDMIDVGQGHQLYVAQFGNANGVPVVYLHGGPGAGHSPLWQRYFNPDFYRIILFDQRGAGKSTPLACVEHNTIDHLIGDVEKIRKQLNIDKWIVGGASWGSALALLYARQYCERVTYLIVRGVFFCGKKDAAYIAEEGGAPPLDPQYFIDYRDYIPAETRARDGLIKSYDRVMKTGTIDVQTEAARRFMLWDTSIAYRDIKDAAAALEDVRRNPAGEIPCTKIFMHYAVHEFDDRLRKVILEESPQLGRIPMFIIHGAHDYVCPVENARALHAAYPRSTLIICDDAGHIGVDGSIPAEQMRVSEFIRQVMIQK